MSSQDIDIHNALTPPKKSPKIIKRKYDDFNEFAISKNYSSFDEYKKLNPVTPNDENTQNAAKFEKPDHITKTCKSKNSSKNKIDSKKSIKKNQKTKSTKVVESTKEKNTKKKEKKIKKNEKIAKKDSPRKWLSEVLSNNRKEKKTDSDNEERNTDSDNEERNTDSDNEDKESESSTNNEIIESRKKKLSLTLLHNKKESITEEEEEERADEKQENIKENSIILNKAFDEEKRLKSQKQVIPQESSQDSYKKERISQWVNSTEFQSSSHDQENDIKMDDSIQKVIPDSDSDSLDDVCELSD